MPRSTARLGLFMVLLLQMLLGPAPPVAARQHALDAAPTMRVRLLETYRPERITLTSLGAPLRLIDADQDRTVRRLQPGETATVTRARGRLHLLSTNPETRPATLTVIPDAGGSFALRVDAGRTRLEERTYPGHLTITPDPARPKALKLVNTLGLEAYVAGIVASEYGLPDLEGSKAMAVVARTYALRARRPYDGTYDHVDHTLSQFYTGTTHTTERAERAAALTRGEVLTYQGQLVEAVYSASSGGHSAANETVWNGAPVPYLRARPDPYDRDSPHHRWTYRVDQDHLHRLLSQALKVSVDGLKIAATHPDGRVARLEASHKRGTPKSLSGSELRRLITAEQGVQSLKSTMFRLRERSGDYVFEGQGFGHGVGLSQWGAHAMAQQGRTYDEILGFYYDGTTLAHQASTTLPALAEAPAADQTVADETAAAPPATQPGKRAGAAAATARAGGWNGRADALQKRPPKPKRRIGW